MNAQDELDIAAILRCRSEQRNCVEWLKEHALDDRQRPMAIMGLNDWLAEEIMELTER